MVINFFGKRGTGKTTAIRGSIRFCKPPVVIVDVLGNFTEPGYHQVTSIPEAIEAIKKQVETGNPSIISIQTEDPYLTLQYMCKCLWEIEGGTLILDEIDVVDLMEGDCFDTVVRLGRNRKIDMITGCRRPAEISKNLTAAANKVYCFQTTEPRDIMYFQETLFGERASILMQLPKYHGLYLDYEKDVWGEFRIDILGNIYHLSQQSLKKTI